MYVYILRSDLIVLFLPQESLISPRSGIVLVFKYIKKGESLGDAELQPELGPVVVVQDRAEGVLLQRVADLPCSHPHLNSSTVAN